MRTLPFLILLTLFSCKDPGTSADTDKETETDTDTDTDADTDTDTDADTDTDTDTDDPSCWVESESGTCYDCDPPTAPSADSLEFLNACTDVGHASFVNADRIPEGTWREGDPLPPVE
ncbi:MAG: hypothetical protein V4850_22860 [Myxococcota bacterium]